MCTEPEANVVAEELSSFFVEHHCDALREGGTGVRRGAVVNGEGLVGVLPKFELKGFFFGPCREVGHIIEADSDDLYV